MAKHLPVTQPAPQVIHYLDPANPTGGLQPLTERELAERRKRDQILYTRWLLRRAELAERDRKVRRFWLGFGVTAGLGVLGAGTAFVWWVATAAASIGLGLLAIPAVILTVGGLAVGGHKCVTIVQHWH
ncbi:hypothetical protein RB614_37515 [Phytohabitans sp. ZYX-F-186]|uniref:Transmembrane protein n=1 Tax=Phytohabitans maris TaxID=3071409 RepID=A0ABU0ZTA8_9ACTN|nr:hypothetical protein [Phytohabitans sp. ZYX-F-186]MDQ7910210.1 hypothetical protein [Phytohabitans sp. ZYX-F-186]